MICELTRAGRSANCGTCRAVVIASRASGRAQQRAWPRSAGQADGLGKLAESLADSGAEIDIVAADASDPDALGARMNALHGGPGVPGVIVYNAVIGAPDQLLSSSVVHYRLPVRLT